MVLWIVFLLLPTKALTPFMTVFGDRAFKEIIKVKLRLLVWTPIQSGWCLYKKRKGCVCKEERHVRTQPSMSQEERPQEKPHLSTFWSWTSSLQTEKINCLGYPVCAVLLWQPEQTETAGTPKSTWHINLFFFHSLRFSL